MMRPRQSSSWIDVCIAHGSLILNLGLQFTNPSKHARGSPVFSSCTRTFSICFMAARNRNISLKTYTSS